MYVVGSIDAYDTVLEEFKVEGFGDTFVCRPDIKSYDCESLSFSFIGTCREELCLPPIAKIKR